MIRADDIRYLRTASPDYAQTEALKMEFRTRRQERHPFFLTADEFDRIFRWKLRGQYKRTAHQRAKNSKAAYRTTTEAALNVVAPDIEHECIARLGVLTRLHGVGVPVASAVLALVDPDRYCVIDFRGWRTVFREKRSAFRIPHYVRYRAAVARLAAELGWPVQETDLAIWEYDRRRTTQTHEGQGHQPCVAG